MKFLTQFSLQKCFALVLFFVFNLDIAQLRTVQSCTNSKVSAALVRETLPTNFSEFDCTLDGALTNIFTNISDSGVNTTIIFSGNTGVLVDCNGAGGDTPEVGINNGQEALRFFTTRFNSTGITTIAIAFSQPVNAIGCDLAHINGFDLNGDLFTNNSKSVRSEYDS